MKGTSFPMRRIRVGLRLATAFSIALCSVTVAAAPAQRTVNARASSEIRFDVTEGTSFSAAAAPGDRPIALDLQGRLWMVPRRGGRAKAISDAMWEIRRPAWSPDGGWVAVQRYTDENWHVFIMRADGGGLRQLTAGPHDNLEPAWSADGKQIVFVSDRGGSFDLWKLQVASSAAEQLAAVAGDESDPVVAPDGRSIAFVRAQSRNFNLVLRDLSSGAEQVLLSGRKALFTPAFSADGRSIAFVQEQFDQDGTSGTRLSTIDVASARIDALSSADSDVFPGRPTWLANGDLLYSADGHIRVRSARSGKHATIPFKAELAVAPKPTYPARDYRFDVRTPQTALGILRPAVAPDGRRIAFTALGDLWMRDDGPVPRRLTDDPYLDVDVAWAPDGRSIAYVSDRRGAGVMDLYVRDLASGQERRLTQTDEDLMMPSWSPDGATIAAFMRNNRDWHDAVLYLVDARSGQMRKLARKESSFAWFLPSQPAWSADGKTIALTALMPASERNRKGTNQILLISTETGAAQYVSPVKSVSMYSRTKHGPIWSPDGRYLAYIENGLLWMIAVHRDGRLAGAPIRLTSEIADAPSWSGDSRSIVYLSLGRLRRVDVESGAAEDIPLDLAWQRKESSAARVVRAGRLYDGVAAKYRENVDIVIDGNRIVEIVPRRQQWPGRQIVDLSSYTVLPGLFQMHVHHFIPDGERDGRNWLAFGITSVREPGADPYEALERRESWAAGRRAGPRLFYAGILEGSRVWYWMNIPVSSTAQVDLELQRVTALDYDFIKTYERMDERVMKRIVEYAHGHGLTVASHEIYPAALYGADVVEHMGTSDRMSYSDRQSLSLRSYDDAIGIMQHAGIAIVPTSAGRAPGPAYLQLVNRHPQLFELPQIKAWPALWRESAQGLYKWQQTALSAQLDLVPNQLDSIRRIGQRGILMATGTDGGTDSHGYSLILEIAYLAESGRGTHAALQAATLHAAQATGVGKDLGSIEPGKLADMIAVDGDPLRDVMDLYRIRHTIKDGQVFSIEELLRAP